MSSVHLFGIRHHGPGSARSLRQALEALQPDIILLEGPPDAEGVLPFVVDEKLKPPVALLVYAPENPKLAAYFPLAHFSPEYQAMRFAFANDIALRFMDLPQAISMPMFMLPLLKQAEALAAKRQEAQENPPQDDEAQSSEAEQEHERVRLDPLGELARAAGYADGERWWDHIVEQRQDSTDIFAAVLEAMTALRSELGDVYHIEREKLREAYMRNTIRQAQASGFERIAVVCGAWHTPALQQMPPAEEDLALLADVPHMDVAATWIPWTSSRLTIQSGYGAGIESPGWYQFLWDTTDNISIAWMTRIAALLRTHDLNASPAQVIDAVRLADTLATLRGRPIPDLHDMNEAALAVLCHGNDAPMKLIAQRLIVGDAMGDVPDEVPMVPLHRNLHQEQQRLKLRPQSYESNLRLDLREERHLAQSHLLHRLGILSVAWGEKIDVSNYGGTFREVWKLNWSPELTIRLIEQSVWGTTIEAAAGAFAVHTANETAELPVLTKLVNSVLLADLRDAVDVVVTQLQHRAALTGDVRELMLSLPALADVLAYSDVRNTHVGMVRTVIDGIVARVFVGLPTACHNIETDPAKALMDAMIRFNNAIYLIDDAQHSAKWYATLSRIVEMRHAHGMLRGRACRMLVDDREMSMEEAVRQMRLVLSLQEEPLHAAGWLEGFLSGSGLILLHDDHLLPILDQWVGELPAHQFEALLPLLRRTFMTFTEPEVRQIARKVSSTAEQQVSAAQLIPSEQTDTVLATMSELLGPPSPAEDDRE